MLTFILHGGIKQYQPLLEQVAMCIYILFFSECTVHELWSYFYVSSLALQIFMENYVSMLHVLVIQIITYFCWSVTPPQCTILLLAFT